MPNDNHYPAGTPGGKGGQFAPDAEGGGDIGTIKLENEKEFHMSPSFFVAAKKLKAKKHMPSEMEADEINVSAEYYAPNIKAYSKMTPDEKKSLLSKSPNGYESLYLETASESQIDALLAAESVINGKIQLEQKIAVLDGKKEKAKEKYEAQLSDFMWSLPTQSVSGVWLGYVSVASYESKSEKGADGLSSIDKKKQYYESIISNESETEPSKEHAKQKLDQLNAFEDAGKKYLDYKQNTIDPQMSAELSAIEEKQQKLYEEQEKYGDGFEEIRLKAQTYIGKFQDKNAAYSKFRKDNAVWISHEWAEKNGYGKDDPTYDVSIKYFGPKFDKMWAGMSKAERDVLINYTGSGYSKFNKPLRGLKHDGWSSFDFAEKVTEMTNAIDKCVWDEDIWVNRGISDSKMFVLPGKSKPLSLEQISISGDIQSLVGTTFKDNGFFSAGAAKETGYYVSPIVFNTYCPKGTKMAYMNTKGNFAYGSENEMILQRGYSYRITKIEKKNGHYYIDCEVILGSDADKVTDKAKLHEMKVKYLGGY